MNDSGVSKDELNYTASITLGTQFMEKLASGNEKLFLKRKDLKIIEYNR